MVVYAVHIFWCAGQGDATRAVQAAAAYSLGALSVLQRRGAREVVLFGSRTVAERIPPAQRLVVGIQHQFSCHAYLTPSKVAVTVTTDSDYPQSAAFALLGQALQAFVSRHGQAASSPADASLAVPELEALLSRYQRPTALSEAEAGGRVAAVQALVDQTRAVVAKNVEDLLRRGERLETLVDRTDQLSASTKVFVRGSRKAGRSCCLLM
eukprot:m51a1_g7929 Synaptobrevin homologue Ykt6 B (210) ;mRNA; f:44419-45130